MEWWPDLESLVFLPHAAMWNWFTEKILFLKKRTSYANGVLLMGQTFPANHMTELSQQ